MCAAIMAKNEGTRSNGDPGNIENTIRSLAVGGNSKTQHHDDDDAEAATSSPYAVDGVILFDTGSTDDTVAVARRVCAELGIALHLKEGAFVDFSTSRNEMLEFADPIADWLVLLDANDELRHAANLRGYVERIDAELPRSIGRHVTQEFNCGVGKFLTRRLIRTKCGWRYRGRVHEYLQTPTALGPDDTAAVPDVVIYQDRTGEGSVSSWARYPKDLKMLLLDLSDNPSDPRTMFYLGQTYRCMGKYEDAAMWYGRRATLIPSFEDERYAAALEAGKIARRFSKNRSLSAERRGAEMAKAVALLTSAYRMRNPPHAEPALEMAEFLDEMGQRDAAWTWMERALAAPVPSGKTFILWFDADTYEYKRYHMASRIAYYVDQCEKGYAAVRTAIAARGLDIDYKNAVLLEDKLGIAASDRIAREGEHKG
jgi:tetratricopeptide (TPR) repeat protein